MSPALEIRGVTKRFVAGANGCIAAAAALRGIDLAVMEGECIAIVGDRGAGKSTLLFCAAGLLAPDAGTIRWFGDDRRSAAATRTSYFFAGARPAASARRTTRCVPHLQLIDAPESLPRDALSRLGRWIERRRQGGDAVLVATRDSLLAHDLSGRVLTLRGGSAFASIPSARPARVAERALFRRSGGGNAS